MVVLKSRVMNLGARLKTQIGKPINNSNSKCHLNVRESQQGKKPKPVLKNFGQRRPRGTAPGRKCAMLGHHREGTCVRAQADGILAEAYKRIAPRNRASVSIVISMLNLTNVFKTWSGHACICPRRCERGGHLRRCRRARVVSRTRTLLCGGSSWAKGIFCFSIWRFGLIRPICRVRPCPIFTSTARRCSRQVCSRTPSFIWPTVNGSSDFVASLHARI